MALSVSFSSWPSASPHPPVSSCTCTHHPPCEQLLARLGASAGSLLLLFQVVEPSAHYPPNEQLLIGMVVGTVSLLSILVWCRCGQHWQCAPTMHPISSCSWVWGRCFCSICHCHCGLGNMVVGVVSMMWQATRDRVHTLQVPCFMGLLVSPCVPPVWCPISVNIPSSTLQAGACSCGDGHGGRLGIRCPILAFRYHC